MSALERGSGITLERLPQPGLGDCSDGGACDVPDLSPSDTAPGSGKGSPPGGSSKTGFKVPKELKTLGQVGKVAMRVRDVYYVACSARTDYKESTTRNTTTTVTGIGASLLGGEAGSVLGAAVGSLLGPPGAVVGGAVGGFIVGYVSKKGAIYAFNTVADKGQYNLEVRSCDNCHTQFVARAYLGEKKCKKCKGGQ